MSEVEEFRALLEYVKRFYPLPWSVQEMDYFDSHYGIKSADGSNVLHPENYMDVPCLKEKCELIVAAVNYLGRVMSEVEEISRLQLIKCLFGYHKNIIRNRELVCFYCRRMKFKK